MTNFDQLLEYYAFDEVDFFTNSLISNGNNHVITYLKVTLSESGWLGKDKTQNAEMRPYGG